MKRGIRFFALALLLLSIQSMVRAQATPDTFRSAWGVCAGNLYDLKLNDTISGSFRVIRISGLITGDRLELDSVNGVLNYCYTGAYTTERKLYYQTDRSPDTTLILFNIEVNADSVLPGDLNQDRIVNGLDLLSLGLTYSEAGPFRDRSSVVFVPQSAPDWLDTFSFLRRPINYKHADADGNGLINAADIAVLQNNYGKSYGSIIPIDYLPGHLVNIRVSDTLGSGLADTLELLLQTTSLVNNLYGLRFRLHYDKRLVRSIQLPSRFPIESSILEDVSGMLRFMQVDADSGYTDYAIAKTSKSGSSGTGELARLIIVIDDNIDGSTMSPGSYTFDVYVDQMIGVSDNGDPVYFNQNALINYSYYISGLEDLESQELHVYPNPASGQFKATWTLHEAFNKFTLIDLYGSEVKVPIQYFESSISADVSALAPGMYILRGETKNARIDKKIFVCK